MRWHPVVIRFALNLRYMSTTAYRGVKQSGFLKLPSERTLSDYTHWASAHSGLQVEFVEMLKQMISHDLPSSDHHVCTLSMDEMKIKSGLVFSRRSGSLVGFTDLGYVHRELECLINDDDSNGKGRLASYAFVFLARAVFKPSLSVP